MEEEAHTFGQRAAYPAAVARRTVLHEIGDNGNTAFEWFYHDLTW